MNKIDRTQTSFRALFGIKARKLKKPHIFQNSISICKALLWASQWPDHFLSILTQAPLMPASEMESCPCGLVSLSCFPTLIFLSTISLPLAIRMIYFPATDACRPGESDPGPFKEASESSALQCMGKRYLQIALSASFPFFCLGGFCSYCLVS